MKKTALILCLIAALLCFTACKKADNAQNTENGTTENTEAAVSEQEENAAESDAAAPEGDAEQAEQNKLEPAAYYGGPVKSIEGDKLTVVSDVTGEEIEFTLSEKAKSDIEHFSVAEGTVVVVDYELSEDGTKTATDVSIVKNTEKTE